MSTVEFFYLAEPEITNHGNLEDVKNTFFFQTV